MKRIILAAVLAILSGSSSTVAQEANTAYLNDLPPLVDRELFFGDPEIAGAQISPDGRFISFLKTNKGELNIWVKTADQPFEQARPITADTARPVVGYFWTQDSRYVLYVQDKGGDENYHVYAVDPTAAADQETGVPSALDLTPYENVQARIVAVPEATPNKIMVSLNDRDPQAHDVYWVDINSGERELIINNEENIAGWLADLEGSLRLAIKFAADGGWQTLRIDGDELTEVYSCSAEETCGPIRFHKDGQRVYMSTNKGDEADLSRLTLYNIETGEEEFIESDPEGEVDFGGAEFSDVTDELVATYYIGDRVRIYPKTDQLKRDLEILRQKLPEGEISLGSSTEDERLNIIRVSRDVDPGSVYLYDRESGEVEFLYRSRPELPSQDLAFTKPVRYQARDGLTIPAYLTLPRGAEPTNLPVVIFPHGGPWARDVWGYDGYAQFLANRGYAVLQPNFRGSTGYGKKFLNAGNNEWGTGAMQHDISDGVKYLVEEGIADPDRVAIFGGSYGGYATLAGLAFTPELYAAGVSYVGPSNLITLLNSIPPYWAQIKKIFDVRLGDPEDPEDRERLIEQSPLFSAKNIVAPLLVIQGANDPRVKKAESEQIVVALRDRGQPVEYILAEDEGHGFASRENRISVAAALEKFVAEQIGGRYQEEMPDEIAARMAALTVDVSTVVLASADEAAASAATAPLPAADGRLIEPGRMQFTTALKVMEQELNVESERTIEKTSVEGQDALRLVDVATLPMMTVVDTLEVDAATLMPIRRVIRGGAEIRLNYSEEAVTGEIVFQGATTPVDKKLEAPVLAGGAGLELVLAGLPLTEGYATTVRVFDAQQQRVRPIKIEVEGTETAESQAGSFETFVVQLTPLDGDEAGTATYHLMKAAPHHLVKQTFTLPAAMGGGMGTTELTSVGADATH